MKGGYFLEFLLIISIFIGITIVYLAFILGLGYILGIIANFIFEERDFYIIEKFSFIREQLVKEHKTYYDNGNLKSEITYYFNTPHGLAVHYYDNGQVFGKCYYTKGRKNGMWISWYNNGGLKETGFWKYNKKMENGRVFLKMESLNIIYFGMMVLNMVRTQLFTIIINFALQEIFFMAKKICFGFSTIKMAIKCG